jgi:hypothetical protein
MKQCKTCQVKKEFSYFYKKKGTKDGYFQWCIACHKEITAKRHAERRKNDINFAKNESIKVINWRKQNPEKFKITTQKYQKDNLPKLIAKSMKYRASKFHRTPIWLSETDFWIIEEAYELAALRSKIFGFLWHVDHIIPLQGKKVSGLHVPTNLQVIPGVENQAKSNRFNI